MKEKKRDESKCIKIKCPKCGSENVIAVKRLTDQFNPVICSSCGEEIVTMGEITYVFEE